MQIWNAFNRFLSNALGVIFILGIVIGICDQSLAAFFKPAIIYLLMGSFFLSFLKVDFASLKDEAKHYPYQIYLLILNMIAMPLIVYYLFDLCSNVLHWIPRGFTIGALILFATASAATVPMICLILKAKFERSVLAVVISSFVMPFSMPFLISLLVKDAPNLDLLSLVYFLAKIILIPLIISIPIKIFYPPIKDKVGPFVSPISIALFFFVFIGCAFGLQTYFLNNLHLVVTAFISSLVAYLVIFVLGWGLALRHDFQDKLTSAVIHTLPNIGTTVVVAMQFFATDFPHAPLFDCVAAITWCIMVSIVVWVVPFEQKRLIHTA